MRWSRSTAALAAVGVAVGAWVLVRSRRRRGLRAWQLVGHRSDLTEGPGGWDVLPFCLEPGREACVLHRAGAWLGFARSCPHAGIDLLGGDIEDMSEMGIDVVVACPAHTYLFDPVQGTCLWDASRGLPETPPLQTYEVRESCGRIWVRPRPLPEPISKEEWDQAKANALQMAAVEKVLARKFPD
ncbi:unnamed protein product [Effrenium voratum]|uniref:Rieske domain-containing protein n=1 Tax=Effrenium voratum TaxID=2562239 RepID=A0AA36JID3_9DINO|nr:unnamed protein product [Effrenium voratum]CAJ1430502.1 unnamed protein product [Effrenium voratum]